MEFSEHDHLFLATICRHFHDAGKWPNYDYLDRVLSDAHEDFDVVAIGRKLEPFMYEGPFVPMSYWDPERWTHLSIVALYTCLTEGICPEVADDLSAFMQGVHVCVEKYRGRGTDKPAITDTELRNRFGMSDLMLRKVATLLLQAGLADSSSYQGGTLDEPAQWRLTVSLSSIRTYRSVTTIDEFVRARQKEREEQRALYASTTIPSASISLGPLTHLPAASVESITSSDDTDSVIAMELVTGTRRYIEKVVRQINTTYDTGCYDACAVMLRRLIETLIIEAFEANGIDDHIKKSTGDFMPLSELVDRACAETSWNLGRNARRALPHLKTIGDRSAHDRRYNAIRRDIDVTKNDLRTAVQELVTLAKPK